MIKSLRKLILCGLIASLALMSLYMVPILQQSASAQSYNNLIVNSGFETNLSGWGGSSTTKSVDSTTSHSGSKSLKHVSDATNKWNAVATSSTWNAVDGQSFRLDAYAKTSLTQGRYQIGVRWISTAGSTIGYQFYTIKNSSSWTRSGGTFVAPANTAKVQVYVVMPQYSIGTVWLDDITLTSDNLALDAGFELNNGSWRGSGPEFSYDSTTFRTGAKSGKITGSASAWNVIATDPAVHIASNESQDYVLKLFSKDTLTSGTFRIGLRYINDAGNSVGAYSFTTAANGANWHQTVTPAMKTPAGTKYVQIYLWLSQNAVGSVWVDDVVLESQNLELNPGFESGMTDWSTTTGVVDTSNAYQGTNSFKLTGSGSAGANTLGGHLVSVSPEESYKVQSYVKSSLTAGGLKMGLRFIQKDGTTVVSDALIDAPLTSAWSKAGDVFTAPADAAFMQVYYALTPDAAGSVWIDNVVLSSAPTPFMFSMTEKHVWTTESTVTTHFALNLTDENLSDYKVKLERYDFGGTTPVFTKEYTTLSPNFADTFNVSTLPMGYSIYKAHLIRKSDGFVKDTEVQEVLKADKLTYPAMPDTVSVTTDVYKAVLLNGDIFMPRIMYSVVTSNTTEYADLKAQGFNTVLIGERGGITFATAFADIKSYGLKAAAALYLNNNVVDLTYISSRVNTYKDDPALLYWVLNDEPDGHGISAAAMQQAYDTIKSIDPNHPVYVNMSTKNVVQAGTYTNATDILSADSYPVPDFDITDVRDMTDAVAATGKPVNMVMQSYGLTNRAPLPEETRAMTYLAINHGAKSTGFYAYDVSPQWFLKTDSPPLWAMYKIMNQELEVLKDVIAAPDVTQNIASSASELDIKVREYNGVRYLFAVNTTGHPVTSTFSGAGLTGITSASPVYESRSVAVSGGSYTDTFSPYMVHIYQLQS